MNRIFRLIVLLLGLWLCFDLASHFTAETLWFGEVGYLREFLLRLATQLGLWAIAVFTSVSFLLSNLVLASRLKYSPEELKTRQQNARKYGDRTQGENFSLLGKEAAPINTFHSPLPLHFLLPLVIILTCVVGAILIFYSQKALDIWHPEIKLPTTPLELPPWLKQVSQEFNPQQLSLPIVQLGLLVVVTVAVLIHQEFWLRSIAVFISLLLGFLVSAQWDKVLLYFHKTLFNRAEPLFHRDISFYVFSLPIWELLVFWLVGLFLFNIAAVALTYLCSGNSLSEGRFPGFSVSQRLHLNAISSLFMLSIALHYWLQRYELLYSTRGVNYGASYTDVTVLLPIDTGLSVLAVAIAAYLLLRVIVLSKTTKTHFKPIPYPPQLIYALGLYVVIVSISGEILPSAVQRLIVQPNELTRERPYIERAITLTREGFNLNTIEARTFDPRGLLDSLCRKSLRVSAI
ncbi:hypothetical protein NUACC21_03370 [Scytonema sp. NUACC21]